jgi:predicted dinucleotide-binding enzyme
MKALFTLCLLILASFSASAASSSKHSSIVGFSSKRPPLRMSSTNPSSTLRITVLGGGNVGSTLAQKLAQSNKFASVEIAARDPAKTIASIQEKGIIDNDVRVVAATPDSLSPSHVVILATPGLYDDEDIKTFASSLGDMTDKIIIDATNPLGPFTDGLQVRTWEGGISGGEKLQLHLPKAKVYKAFNTVGVEHMREALGKEMLIAGDPDPSHRAIAEAVVKAVGFKPFFVGPIKYSRNLEAMAELWIHMAIPGLGGRDTSRNFWFSIGGDP